MIRKILIVLLVVVASNAYAQEGTSSPYSFYGIGIQKFKGTAENRAMGGLSVYGDSIHLNLQNPAAYGGLKLTTYALGATYNTVTIKSDTQKESTDNATIDYLSIGIPAGKFGFGFGLVPFSTVGYELIAEADTQSSRFTGSGGVNKVYFSAGYEVIKGLKLGLEANYNFGNIENKIVLEQDDVQYATREVNKSSVSGFSYSFGAMYTRSLNEKLTLNVSATIDPTSRLNLDNSRELSTVIVNGNGQESVVENQTITVPEGKVDLATGYSFGAGIGQPKKWFVGAEYAQTAATDFQNRTFSTNNVVYDNATRMSLGGFYIPKYNSLTSYFKRVVYRAGARYEETGLTIDGEGINEFGISFGVGLPIGTLFSNANIGFEYGQRGTVNAGLVKEDFFNISIGLSLNDKWFRKLKYN
ncbi:hypothetical protein [Aquimarina rhabdastrellae]